MGKILDAIDSILFPNLERDEPDADAPLPIKNRFIPARNDHAYYVRRLDSLISEEQAKVRRRKEEKRQKHYAAKGWADDYDRDYDGDYEESKRYRDHLSDSLSKLSLNTLKMMDEHHRLSDLDLDTCQMDESRLRSLLLLNAQPDNQEHRMSSLGSALSVMVQNHEIPKDDLTAIPKEQARLVGAACRFLIESGAYQYAPPRLTEFVMERPDRVKDIIAYMQSYQIKPRDLHNIDLEHAERFLDSPAQSLREGEL